MDLWRNFYKHCWQLLGADRKRYLMVLATITIVFTYNLVPPFAVGKVVDYFSDQRNETQGLTFPIAIALLIGLFWCIASILRLWSKNQLSQLNIKLEHKARLQCFSAISGKSLAWHDDMSSGQKLQRVTTGSEALKEALRTSFNKALSYIAQVAGVTLFFLTTQWPLFLIFTLYLTLFANLQIRFQRRIRVAENDLQETREQASGQIIDKLGNIRTTKVLGRTKASIDHVQHADNELKANSLYIAKLSFHKWISFQITNGFFLSATMVYVVLRVNSGSITIGEIMVYLTYIIGALTNVSQVSSILIEISELIVRASRIFPYLSSDDDLLNDSYPQNWQKLTIDVRSFSYKNSPALENIALTINRGSSLGVIGPSGCGKSTLAMLLTGQYEPDTGSVMLDDTAIATIAETSRGRKITTVLQEVEVFNLPLRENITLGLPDESEQLQRVTKAAILTDLINDLPNGLETVLGERGYRLSGGERQRIGIARALYSQPDILILDEATSALDSETEQNIQDEITKLFGQITIIAIAHRTKTLEQFDRVIELREGKLIDTSINSGVPSL